MPLAALEYTPCHSLLLCVRTVLHLPMRPNHQAETPWDVMRWLFPDGSVPVTLIEFACRFTWQLRRRMRRKPT